MIVYLHDIPYSVGNRLAANKKNIDTVFSVEKCLKNNRNVLLTADDGYKSVKNLLPLLEKYNVKLIFFITTGFLDKSVYPYEVELSNFLERNSALSYEGKSLLLEDVSVKEEFFGMVHKQLKYLSLRERNNHIDSFFLENGGGREEYVENIFVTWQDLRELAKHPLVEIGSHCVSHVFLPSQDLSTIIFELKESKARIEHELGKKVTKLSYPYGGSNFKVKVLAKALGYKETYATNDKKYNFMDKGRVSLSKNVPRKLRE
ncbi:polysaccharide deacetylase family protein [Marinobacter oulmenensis]|uniref:Peptidoglycan/xylan/chitin deacetylase (PgdA/CDA1 family) n=1 Tax=Marinobacter oulmenensis TaxID=643747 RepID=A0A840UJN9_9GAMM|nr:polysaccharide deacetylase family protein [Marinobacter oulmenensis]MBB5322515.1 peptidoglycan/xylan/chitin deacetylase (PgdA/CDA1 family) [Marinobacter oulmenensis]